MNTSASFFFPQLGDISVPGASMRSEAENFWNGFPRNVGQRIPFGVKTQNTNDNEATF